MVFAKNIDSYALLDCFCTFAYHRLPQFFVFRNMGNRQTRHSQFYQLTTADSLFLRQLLFFHSDVLPQKEILLVCANHGCLFCSDCNATLPFAPRVMGYATSVPPRNAQPINASSDGTTGNNATPTSFLFG